MAGPGEGGPVRLAILLGSLAGLLLIAVHTIGAIHVFDPRYGFGLLAADLRRH